MVDSAVICCAPEMRDGEPRENCPLGRCSGLTILSLPAATSDRAASDQYLSKGRIAVVRPTYQWATSSGLRATYSRTSLSLNGDQYGIGVGIARCKKQNIVIAVTYQPH